MKCYAIHKYLSILSLLKITKLPRKRMAVLAVNYHFLYRNALLMFPLFFIQGKWYIIHHILPCPPC
jgi:hypothetical protein